MTDQLQKTAESNLRTQSSRDSAGSGLNVLFSEDEIGAQLQRLARDIAAENFERLLIVAILKGSFVFAADLIRALHQAGLAPDVDFITLASYRTGTVSSGTVEILRDLDLSVEGRSVLIIDDVLDSGRTLHFAKNLLNGRGAGRVLTCVLISKQVTRACDIEADFKAFDCGEHFVVGYGMDASHRYRELPFVAVLKDES